MYVGFTPPKGNQVSDLVDYLSKEDNVLDKQQQKLSRSVHQEIRDCVDYLAKEDAINGERELFFTTNNNEVERAEVSFKISNNTKGLKNNESKFYMANISPSKAELEHIWKGVDKYCAENNIADKETVFRTQLKDYANDVMDQYAQNFEREGINSKENLVWYGKVEKYRYWKHDSKEVITNDKLLKKIKNYEKAGAPIEKIEGLRAQLLKDGERVIYCNMPKSGDNHHLHIVVSRKDVEQKVSLSPMTKFKRSENHIVNGTACKAGFDKMEFARRLEKAFDKKFDYIRPFEQTIDACLKYKELRELNTKINTVQKKIQIVNVKEELHIGVRNYKPVAVIEQVINLKIERTDKLDQMSLQKVSYDVENRIWERQQPNIPRPYHYTVEGQTQLIAIRQATRKGLDTMELKASYKIDRRGYNIKNGIEKVKTNKPNMKPQNILVGIGKSVGNSLFSEIHFNELAKGASLAVDIGKTIYKSNQLAETERQLKAVNAVIYGKSSLSTAGNLSHNYAAKAVTNTAAKIGKGLANKAMTCAAPVLVPVKVLQFAVGLVKGKFTSNELEQ